MKRRRLTVAKCGRLIRRMERDLRRAERDAMAVGDWVRYDSGLRVLPKAWRLWYAFARDLRRALGRIPGRRR